MNCSSSPVPNGHGAPSPDCNTVDHFPHQSFPASFTNGPRSFSHRPEEHLRQKTNPQMSNILQRNSSNLFVNIPARPNAADAALTALQFLPTPLIILSSSKTVLTANDAMARLLGLDKLAEADHCHESQSQQEDTPGDLLRGQSLSQIGIDMMQEDGQPIWVSWEVCKNWEASN